MSQRKELRFYPKKDPQQAAILQWLEQQRGSDNTNLIYLLKLGFKAETGQDQPASSPTASSVTPNAIMDILPEIRKIVNASIKSALRDANISISQNDQEELVDKETQDFIIAMADNF